MRRDAQAVLLLLVGGTMLKIGLNGTYVRFVKPSLLPLVLVSGAALVAMAVVAIAWHVQLDIQSHGLAHEHEHDGHSGRAGWLLVVPALLLLVAPPPALGSFQATRNGTALDSAAYADFPPLPDGDPVRVSLFDYAGRAVFDQGQSLAQRRVTLSGFVIRGPNGETYLARMVMSCCAADARPIKVGLAGNVPANLDADDWLEVDGTYVDRSDRDPVNDEIIPYLDVAEFRALEAPESQYES